MRTVVIVLFLLFAVSVSHNYFFSISSSTATVTQVNVSDLVPTGQSALVPVCAGFSNRLSGLMPPFVLSPITSNARFPLLIVTKFAANSCLLNAIWFENICFVENNRFPIFGFQFVSLEAGAAALLT